MLGVSRTSYKHVTSPNQGFPYFNFLGGKSPRNSYLLVFPQIFFVAQDISTWNVSQSLRDMKAWRNNPSAEFSVYFFRIDFPDS